jgi:hypothetical protein
MNDRDPFRCEQNEGAMSTGRDLYRIFTQHQGYLSDKWEHYISIYESAFARLVARGEPVRLLEIGVQNGGSLQIWSEYLPQNSTIVGIDVDPACAQLSFKPNVAILIGDTNDPGTLDSMLADARFNLIIENGSHHAEHLVATFEACFRRLNPSGIYIIENLHASYDASHGGGLRVAGTSMEWLKGLLDALNADHIQNDACETIDEPTLQRLRDLGRQIACISFFDSVVLIEKLTNEKHAPYRRIMAGRETLVVDTAAQAMSVLPYAQLRELLLPPCTAAAFAPAMLDAVASARERVGELQTLLIQADARSKENERAREQVGELRALLAQAEAQASRWKTRAEESEIIREQIVRRMDAARRDVYEASYRREKAEVSAQEAITQRKQAEAVAALAAAQISALLASTTWQMTWPIRVVGSWLTPDLRCLLRRPLKFAWRTLTFGWPRKLREHRVAQTPRSLRVVAQEEPQPKAPVSLAPPEGRTNQNHIDKNLG